MQCYYGAYTSSMVNIHELLEREVRPGALEESVSTGWLKPTMNARDTANVMRIL